MLKSICLNHFTGRLPQKIDSNTYIPNSDSQLRSNRPDSVSTCPDGSRPSDGGKFSLATAIVSDNSAYLVCGMRVWYAEITVLRVPIYFHTPAHCKYLHKIFFNQAAIKRTFIYPW